MSSVIVRQMTGEDIPGVVALQRACFPEPFPEELLWNSSHLSSHLSRFRSGQFVAEVDGEIVGSCSNALVSETVWSSHGSWTETFGDLSFSNHNSVGTTLYGADISVSPSFRKKGIGRSLYQARFDLVSSKGLSRYGTACRVPGLESSGLSIFAYYSGIITGSIIDRVASPLLKVGLIPLKIVENYMEDPESLDCALLLEWNP